MKVCAEQHFRPCGCRSVGECGHNTFIEIDALIALVDAFAMAIKKKLQRKLMEGYSGWDDPTWTPDNIRAALIAHMEKGDPVDIGAFAAFLWNRQ